MQGRLCTERSQGLTKTDRDTAYVHSVNKGRSVPVREVPIVVFLIDANIGQPVDSMLCRGCPVSARIDNDPAVAVIGNDIGTMKTRGNGSGTTITECRIVSDFNLALAVQDSRSIGKGTNVRAELAGHVEYLREGMTKLTHGISIAQVW